MSKDNNKNNTITTNSSMKELIDYFQSVINRKLTSEDITVVKLEDKNELSGNFQISSGNINDLKKSIREKEIDIEDSIIISNDVKQSVRPKPKM